MMRIKLGSTTIKVENEYTPEQRKLLRKLKKTRRVFFADKPVKNAHRLSCWYDGFSDVLTADSLNHADTVLPLAGSSVPKNLPIKCVPSEAIEYEGLACGDYLMETPYGKFEASDDDLVIVHGVGIYHPNMFAWKKESGPKKTQE